VRCFLLARLVDGGILGLGGMDAAERENLARFRADWIDGHLDHPRAEEALTAARHAWKRVQQDSAVRSDPETLRRIKLDIAGAEQRLAQLDATLGEWFDRFCGLMRANPGGTPREDPSNAKRTRWPERVVGFGLVAVGVLLFYMLCIPGLVGSEFGLIVVRIAGVCGVFFGMPLLVTGRIRQVRRR
jgi:hypothetical protein